ncbi:hypothetical protein [Phyllobacterium brassicacearum]|uniref:hypothetical protein n=1 Tax=Phyllobacterium brassicacearum TaxID=314235 RepID=UPI0010F3E720|nr:hypothetical protein [Phyllobacterium brassicacearum]TDQ13614.1 hypothetical protein DEV91_1413 [Phyllobacterium brassicacearum]
MATLNHYLTDILEDSAGYPLFEENRAALRRLFDQMVTFDTVILTDDGTVLIPKRDDTT